MSVINADEVYHTLVEKRSPCTDAIAGVFGSEYIKDDGSLDRKKLGALVFSDRSELSKLNSTVHPFVVKEIEAILETLRESGAGAAVIDAPQLFEAGCERFCDVTLGVIAPFRLSVKRICERDGISPAEAASRIRSQHSSSFFRRRCDVVINNSGSVEDFRNKLDAFIRSHLTEHADGKDS